MMQVESKSQFVMLPGRLPWNVAFSSLEHSSKQLSPKEVTEEGIVMAVKPENRKQSLPKEVTEEEIVMLAKPKHSSKQLSPKEVTEEGIVMLVKP